MLGDPLPLLSPDRGAGVVLLVLLVFRALVPLVRCSWQWLGGGSGEWSGSSRLLSLDLAFRIMTVLNCGIEDWLVVVDDLWFYFLCSIV